MNREWPACYRRIDSLSPGSEGLEAWASTAIVDTGWDDFLRGAPCGQYQQSSLWAEFKAGEGWRHHRVVLTDAAGIAGGFQILWKKKGPVRIGYVSKGPVARIEGPTMVGHLGRLLAAAAGELGLSALIVQQPDDSRTALPCEAEIGWMQSNPMKVDEATYVVSVSDGVEALRSRMSTTLRKNLRQGQRQGTIVREGTAADLPRFFELMAASCRRQNTAPNPGTAEAIERVWRIFSRSGAMRLTVADCAGQVPAAMLSIVFGSRVSLWKKGWDGSHGDWHPTKLVETEALDWACGKSHLTCDFCNFERPSAERVLKGRPGSVEGLTARDSYHLRYGGRPQLLPPALILIPHPILRWFYRNTFGRRDHKREHVLHIST